MNSKSNNKIKQKKSKSNDKIDQKNIDLKIFKINAIHYEKKDQLKMNLLNNKM